MSLVHGCGDGTASTEAASTDTDDGNIGTTSTGTASTDTDDGSTETTSTAAASTATDIPTTSGAMGVCGDGIVDDGEACDEGTLNGAPQSECATDCTVTTATSIAAGTSSEHTCAAMAGRLRCWGDTFFNQLGHGKSYDNAANIGDDEPASSAGDVMVGGLVADIAVGGEHTCVRLVGGKVRCWGLDSDGQIGYGDLGGTSMTPAELGDVPLPAPVVQLSAGAKHTCALFTDSSLVCWGSGTNGQTGQGDTFSTPLTPAGSVEPVDVGGIPARVATGGQHTCVVLEGGGVKCWGRNSDGQLGLGHTQDIGDDELPSSVGEVDVGGTVVQLVAGGDHTCALLDDGSVKCWGLNDVGQLGLGHTMTIGDDELPSSVGAVDLGGTPIQLSAGESHTCALLESGTVRCWGSPDFGSLGYGDYENIGDDESPASAGDIDVGGPVVQVATGRSHTCALLAGGAIRCWGNGTKGALGYGNTNSIGDDEVPSTAGDVPVW